MPNYQRFGQSFGVIPQPGLLSSPPARTAVRGKIPESPQVVGTTGIAAFFGMLDSVL